MADAGWEVHPLVRKAGSVESPCTITHDLLASLADVPSTDWIFHLAGAYAGAAMAELRDADLAIAQNLIRWGVSAGVRNWIFASAAEVYGEVTGFATEDSPTVPVIPYGQTKLEIERLLIQELGKLSGYRLVILRLGEVYGLGSKLLTELTTRLNRGFCPWPGSGNVNLSFVHVDDVAAAFLCAAQNAREGAAIYNIGDASASTWREFLLYVARRCQNKGPQFLPVSLVKAYAVISTLANQFTGRDPVLTLHALRLITTPKLLSSVRARRELQFQPRYPDYLSGLEEALRGLSHDPQNGKTQTGASR
jgi:nucleoside-diphosphate-sugar epimerase